MLFIEFIIQVKKEMSAVHRPQNALKRCEELMQVGQTERAFLVLHSTVTSDKIKGWDKSVEDIMLRYVELVVELRKVGEIMKKCLSEGLCLFVFEVYVMY